MTVPSVTFHSPTLHREFSHSSLPFLHIIYAHNESLELLSSSVASVLLFNGMLASEPHSVRSNNAGLATMDFSVLGSLEFVLPYLKQVSLLVSLHNEAMMTPDSEWNTRGDGV